jgi:hypothetical protein
MEPADIKDEAPIPDIPLCILRDATLDEIASPMPCKS